MYVGGVPVNYGGTAFADKKCECENKSSNGLQSDCEDCNDCKNESKNPFSCIINALKRGKDRGIDAEDILLLLLIAMLVGKGGNEDVVFILTMLLIL